MNGRELIDCAAGRKLALLSTATTGIRPQTDIMLAACAIIMTPDAEEIHTAYNKGAAGRASEGFEFHGITEETLASRGLEQRRFEEELGSWLVDCAVLSYNPQFQMAFLANSGILAPVYDLPLLFRGVESRLVVDCGGLEGLKDLTDRYVKVGIRPLGFKRLCEVNGIRGDAPSDPPFRQNAQCLKRLYLRLADVVLGG